MSILTCRNQLEGALERAAVLTKELAAIKKNSGRLARTVERQTEQITTLKNKIDDLNDRLKQKNGRMYVSLDNPRSLPNRLLTSIWR